MSRAAYAPEGYTFTADMTLKSHVCPICGLGYAIPQQMAEEACKLGHGQITWRCPRSRCADNIGYHGESAVERERRNFERERNRANAERDTRRETERRLSAQRGATTRARKRHVAGVCPACKRSFKQVREHMERMHPDYDPAKHRA